MLKLEASLPSGSSLDLERIVETALAAEQRTLDRVSVSFVDAGTMRRLNQEHRGLDRPTDVLSFPFDSGFPQGTGGEVVVCQEAADLSAPRALERLVIHGLLHLLGYRDDTDVQLAEMERRTDTIMERLDAGL